MNNEKRLCLDRLLLLMLKVVLWQKSSSKSLGLVCPRVLQTKNEKKMRNRRTHYLQNILIMGGMCVFSYKLQVFDSI